MGTFRGIQISQDLKMTHLLFMDDVLIFCSGSVRELNTLYDILKLFSKVTGMEINVGKSTMSTHLLSDMERQEHLTLFPFNVGSLERGLKYPSFYLKPNDYRKQDWVWLLEKMEKRLKQWSRKWLSRASRLVSVKVVQEAIPVYWMSLA